MKALQRCVAFTALLLPHGVHGQHRRSLASERPNLKARSKGGRLVRPLREIKGGARNGSAPTIRKVEINLEFDAKFFAQARPDLPLGHHMPPLPTDEGQSTRWMILKTTSFIIHHLYSLRSHRGAQHKSQGAQ